MKRLMLLPVLFFPLAVFAQDAAPAPSLWSQLLTPANVALAIGAVLGVLGLVLGNNAVWKRRLALAGYHAFHVVNDIDAERGDEKLDKVAAGLKAANDYMLAQGWRVAKPAEVELLKMQFQALNGVERQAVKIAAQAQALAATTSPR